MSRRLLRLEIPVFPDRRMFRLHDATVDPDGPGSPAPPEGALISVTREQMWVASLQEIVSAQLLLEEWDSAPPPFGEKWEDEAKAVLYLRGAVSIDMGSAGKAVESLKLAGGVGDYVVRVFARNRTEVTRRYQDLSGAAWTRSATSSSGPAGPSTGWSSTCCSSGADPERPPRVTGARWSPCAARTRRTVEPPAVPALCAARRSRRSARAPR